MQGEESTGTKPLLTTIGACLLSAAVAFFFELYSQESGGSTSIEDVASDQKTQARHQAAGTRWNLLKLAQHEMGRSNTPLGFPTRCGQAWLIEEA